MKTIRSFAVPRASDFQRGIVLLEALIAILLFSIGILGIVGLQATMIKGTTEGKIRADANYAAAKTVAGLWMIDPLLAGALVGVQNNLSPDLGLPPNATITTTRGDTNPNTCAGDIFCFTVVVNWQSSDGTTHSVTNSAHINPPPNYTPPPP